MNIPENERIKQLKLLKSTYEMYEKTKKDTETKMKQKMNPDGSPYYTPEKIKETLNLIQGMQDDTVDQFIQFGGNPEELKGRSKRGQTKSVKKQMTVSDVLIPESPAPTEIKTEPPVVKKVSTNDKVVDPVAVASSRPESHPVSGAIYDVIPLPSGGQCYPGGLSRVKVAYLTAYDENILVSPNLYRDNLVLDEILRNKLIDCPIDPENLLQGDRDAIILWLRATGYGNDFPISATDNESGKQFEAVVDLSKIKFKPFTLKGDGNGMFEFETPLSKDKIKFRFLTAGDNAYLDKLNQEEKMRSAPGTLEKMGEDITALLESDTVLDREGKKKVFDAQNALAMWKDKLVENAGENIPYTNIITNRMQMMIMEVNGESDRNVIHDYVMGMSVRDAAAFRKYVTDNEPGLDFNLEVERPESLGGGTLPVFLQLDQYLFLNIA